MCSLIGLEFMRSIDLPVCTYLSLACIVYAHALLSFHIVPRWPRLTMAMARGRGTNQPKRYLRQPCKDYVLIAIAMDVSTWLARMARISAGV